MNTSDNTQYLDVFYGPVMACVADCLRGLIVAPPGKELIAVDFANIEGRVLAWLAGEEWKLQAFRDYDAGIGPDVYLIMAADLYAVPVSSLTKKSPERQPGKGCELAFGFEGGVAAWRKIEKSVGDMPAFTDDQIDFFKNKWRGKHLVIKAFWKKLNAAAMEAVRVPGAIFAAGAFGRECRFRKAGSFLWCQLPTGRLLCYPYPEIRPVKTPWGEMRDALTYKTELDSTTRKSANVVEGTGSWCRISTYGGSLAENVTQAVARDLLAEAITRLDGRGFEVIFHVHDEVVLEVDANAPATMLGNVERIVASTPAWATGLPIAVEGWRARRYRK